MEYLLSSRSNSATKKEIKTGVSKIRQLNETTLRATE